ncbi:MAG: lipid A biosynthesis acyltransferase [Devosiaceae bacterium]|nr:lipid A biosynthesis acyltransferase [Devosiaceae bacterium MH13]
MPQRPSLSLLSSALAYGAVRVATLLLRLMGLERASAFMGWAWRTAAPWTKRHPRALSQLEAALPDTDAAERQRIAKHMWDGLGRTFAEGLLLDRLMAAPERISVTSALLAAELADPSNTPNGVIYVSLHAGNWEALGVPLAHAGAEVAGLYQSVQNPFLEADLLKRRQALYRAGMISKGSDAMKRIISILKSGRAIAMLGDQRQAHKGVPIQFFGHTAPTSPLPARLALKTGARLVMARCKPVGPVRFEIDLVELTLAPSGDLDDDVFALTQAIQSQLEAWIRERPHEWMWAHRRWSRETLTARGA